MESAGVSRSICGLAFGGRPAAAARLCGGHQGDSVRPNTRLSLSDIDPSVLHRAGVTAVDEPYRAARQPMPSSVTEWPQFTELDWRAVAREAPGAVVVDTRNVLNGLRLPALGLTREALCRKASNHEGKTEHHLR